MWEAGMNSADATSTAEREPDFYLYTCSSLSSTVNSGNVFYRATGAETTKTLRRLFYKECAFDTESREFCFTCADEFEPEDQILFDEAIDKLDIYDDPDPYIYDPPPSGETMLRAYYKRRAEAWEGRIVPQIVAKQMTTEAGPGEPVGPHSSATDARTQAISAPQINGTIIHGDQYINYGQAGAIGQSALGTVNTFHQCWRRIESAVDLTKLATELTTLRSELVKSATNAVDYVQLGILAEAEREAESRNGPEVMGTLSRAAKAVLATAERIGTDIAAKVIVEAAKG
jgi:hypothetical protein